VSEPGRLLDLPDEPRREWRGVGAAALGAAAVVVVGIVVARTFAFGGFERPWLAVQAVVALPAMVVAWLLAGPHRARTWVTAAAMIVGLALQPVATSGATPSPTRLAQIVDALGLPGTTVREVRIGNGRCRPACSELRRTTVARGMSYASARAEVEGLMRARGFAVKMYGHHAGQPERIDANSDTLRAQFELRESSLAVTRIAQVWIAVGPTPSNTVG
jgi:hypothetical protein